MSSNSTDEKIREAALNGTTAKEIRAALGRGGHFSLSAAIKRLGLKPSKPGTVKGPNTFYDDDTTFSA